MTTEIKERTDWTAAAPAYNLIQASDITGLSRSTLERMLRDGMPYVERADRDKRREWKLRIGDVMIWRMLQKREEIATKQGALPAPISDPFLEDLLDDMVLQLRGFLAAIGRETNAKRREAMIGNILAVIGRFELYRDKA